MAITYNVGTQNRCNMRKRDTPKLGNIPCFPTLRALPAYLIGFLPSFGLYIGSTLRALIMDTTITSSFREGHEEAQGRSVGGNHCPGMDAWHGLGTSRLVSINQSQVKSLGINWPEIDRRWVQLGDRSLSISCARVDWSHDWLPFANFICNLSFSASHAKRWLVTMFYSRTKSPSGVKLESSAWVRCSRDGYVVQPQEHIQATRR